MAWCDVVEPRTLRECRIALGQSQAAFALPCSVRLPSRTGRGMPGGGRRRRRCWHARSALATHRNDHELLPLPVLALLIGVHVKTLRAAARDGRLPVTYDTRTTFRRLRARATPAAARAFRRSYYGRTGEAQMDRRAPLTWASVPSDYDEQIRALRRARGLSQAQLAITRGRGAQSRRLPMGGADTHAVARCSGNESPRSTGVCRHDRKRTRDRVSRGNMPSPFIEDISAIPPMIITRYFAGIGCRARRTAATRATACSESERD